LRLYRRDGVWHCCFYDARGRRVRRSTKCTDKRAAEAAARRWERAAHAADHAAKDAPAYSLDQAVVDFLSAGLHDVADATAEMYRQKSGHLCRLLGSTDLADLALDNVLSFVDARLTEGAARGTVSKELVTLRRVLTLAQERGLFTKAPAAVIPKFRARYVPKKRFLTLDEFQQLLAAFEKSEKRGEHLDAARHRQMWICVAVFTGGRDSEVSELDWSDIDWRHRRVHLRGTKTDGSDRVVPLHPVLAEILEKSRKERGPIVGAWANVRRDLAAACERIGIERVSPNDLRRTFASWMKQAGIDSYAVASLLGHRTARMVELVYGRLDERALFNAMSALPGAEDLRVKYVPHARGLAADNAPTAQPGGGALTDGEQGVSRVLGAGIEPATRGFSIRARTIVSDENVVRKSRHLRLA
jgi:integrase